MRATRPTRRPLRPYTRPLSALLALTLGTAHAGYSTDAVVREITAQALKVPTTTPPVAATRLAALLPKRCVRATPSRPRLAQGHAEATYGTTRVLLDDFAGRALNTVMGAAFEFGQYADVRDAALVRPMPGALGYTVFEPRAARAQTRVWVGGRFVVQIIAESAHSRSDVDACLRATGLAGLAALSQTPP
ncbi:hypothetical protein [Deinococcus hopiensis]|uniref:Uncharacterized protein n=1 Tax=Deinococcus hopiensis KR-140 TaxID=695939 RepID=A0A1W1VW27_9DEIO|nr:hypothetical protein [Deinococcus hopiensis]SMB97538.1 hypothetical protein SAMN00790413_06033 [Deinococcus hopiensis KR-140]